MSSNFPTALDVLTNPTPTDYLNSPSHAGQHANANDILEALEAKVGINSSAVTTSHDYKLSGVTGIDKAASLAGSETLTNKTLTLPILTNGVINFNPPRGFLINGKIVVTDTGSGLNVAIKTLAGTDPSATNPVYCRIGDTVRSITSALSRTLADGTNWFNSGSSELATKEVDYFVYLVYDINVNNLVNIAFARVPYGSLVSDFNSTTTNATYLAGYTNFNTTDEVENIGRFAATLSAGTGYTWSVPTFTGSNLIQRPIFESRMLTWTPTFSAVSPMTWTSVSINTIGYRIRGTMIYILLNATGTTGGTANPTINATLPIAIKSFGGTTILSGSCIPESSTLAGFSYIGDGLSLLNVRRYDGANFGLGAGRGMQVSLEYPII